MKTNYYLFIFYSLTLFVMSCGDHQPVESLESSPSTTEAAPGPEAKPESKQNENQSFEVRDTASARGMKSSKKQSLSYYKNIRPLFDRKCSVCHNSSSRLDTFDSYDETYQYRDLILDRISLETSQPHGMKLSSEEQNLISRWIDSGAPEGEPVDVGSVFLPEMALLSFDYERDIKPVFERKCSLCHNSSSKLGDWQNYEEVYFKRQLLYERTVKQADMPPLGSPTGNLSAGERSLIEVWLNSLTSKDEPEELSKNLKTLEPVYFEKEIQTLFNDKCASCHNANSSIPNWLNYETAFSKRAQIHLRVVIKKDMPPQDSVTGALNSEDVALIVDWIASGAKK